MTHGGTSIAMRRRLWVRGYCVSPSWNVHVDCVGATCTGYTLFNMVRICGAPSTRYFIFNHMRYLNTCAMRYSHRPGPVGRDMDMRGPRVRAHAGPLPQQRTEYTQTGRHRYPRGRRTGTHGPSSTPPGVVHTRVSATSIHFTRTAVHGLRRGATRP